MTLIRIFTSAIIQLFALVSAVLALAVLALAVPTFSTAQDNYVPPPQFQNNQRQNNPANLPAFTHPQSVPQDLARVDAGLNATVSFQGRFTQYGTDGSVSTGTVHLQRPGRVRFEYDSPNPLLIVSDGVTLVQQDHALQTFDRVPLSATPLNYLLKENIELARDTGVIGFQKLQNRWRVTARDESGEMAGAITLVFDPNSLALVEWVIRDEFGGTTTVHLSELVYNQHIDPRLFILRDQREDRRRRRR